MTKTSYMLPTVAAVLPAEKLNETLVKYGLLPCCRLKKDELEAQGRRVLGSNHKDILRIPYSAVKNIGELQASRAKSLIRWLILYSFSQGSKRRKAVTCYWSVALFVTG